eukprot:813419-Lingulodinium_polyedra.AAC.1
MGTQVESTSETHYAINPKWIPWRRQCTCKGLGQTGRNARAHNAPVASAVAVSVEKHHTKRGRTTRLLRLL